MTTVRAAAREATMPVPASAPPFAVISGAQVRRALRGREREIVRLVEAAYWLHSAGEATSSPSCVLRFPDRPSARIVALPASMGGRVRVHGLTWLASFPENATAGLPRASAVLILNDHDTGYPIACLESSVIGVTRTAAFAVLAADRLGRGRPRPARVGFLGAGPIARAVHTFLAGTGWSFREIGVHDRSAAGAAGFRGYLERWRTTGRITVYRDAESLIRGSELVVLATAAGRPQVHDPSWLDHRPLVLHLSPRDLAPEVLLASTTIVDDVVACLRANASAHLAERLTGGRDFLCGTLADVLAGRVAVPADRPVVFSPSDLGVLDLAVAKDVYDRLARAGELRVVEDFFQGPARPG
ncbi:2,3-diaminopropionate biosynthesis protein SbnB [Gandjariella thermophila]|uniref:2,3-diaminopropionate biosynthesis protein SbnB n=1 Tax=Gandjariella thermophila TaxID=1931992 RepID=A0A4D4J8X7_9PSEU|nr:2,3-diaminopropionate biosynthesis protein SbnB [Gandjariella thermophila]GDY31692.1 2,3-diaminopropionate biosynthesis protein SbnB [Gandjariella thermophila]